VSWSAAAHETALLTVAQMAAADRAAIAAGTPGTQLMQNAGMAVVREIARRWSPRPVTVLCGPGNNGGDGFVAAVELKSAGWAVRVALLGALEAQGGDARHHATRWRGPVEAFGLSAIEGAELIVDALYGSGLNRELDASAAGLLAAAAQRKIPLIAIDVPSGVVGDSGESLGAVAAHCTVTFVRKKPGHLLYPGRGLCGDTVVAQIGSPATMLDSIVVDACENDPGLWRQDLPRPGSTGNKFSRGHALLIGGYPMTGAARMAARAAARAGAGLTTIAVPEAGFPIYAAALTSIMVQSLAKRGDLEHLLEDSRYTGLLIGPGAGVDATTRETALALLHSAKPVVLDADAISVFAKNPGALWGAIRGPCVLTPHEGEFARIFDLRGDKLKRARAAAALSGAVIVLKGADTVIAAPDGRCIINSNAPAGLATAGSGDVLGGFILGLLTQGMDAFLAAAAGVWLHGAAASEFGPGLLAEDLPDLLPAVLRRLNA
jgi:hydroxyethylthiazole kinase-like uncharacterized protein yjeF